MSKFWKAGPKVVELIEGYDSKTSPTKLEKILGVRLNFVVHYKQGGVYLETPEDAILQNCAEVSEGQFLSVLAE